MTPLRTQGPLAGTPRKEHGFLYTADMIRAQLKGRKAVTRRPVTRGTCIKGKGAPKWGDIDPMAFSKGAYTMATSTDGWLRFDCRFQVGDLIWSRETFKVEPSPGATFGDVMMNRKLSVFYKDGERKDVYGGSISAPGFHVDIAAPDYDPAWYGRWRPSIHMPRWASRITREITEMRAEPVNDITEEDAVAEGLERRSNIGPCRAMGWAGGEHMQSHMSPIDAFRNLWDSCYGHGAFDSGMLVWRLAFKEVGL